MCGILIIISKILLDRPQIAVIVKTPTNEEIVKLESKQKMLNDDSDEEEYYADVHDDNKKASAESNKKKKEKKSTASWFYATIKKEEKEVDDAALKKETNGEEVKEEKPHKAHKVAVQYDHYFRNPAGAGAQYEELLEMIRVKEHFHPTVQKFCDSISASKWLCCHRRF